MKYFKFLALILITSIGFSSCKKEFLNVENTQQLYRQTYVKDIKSMQEFVNGIYVGLSTTMEDGLAAAYPELVADNLKPVSTTINVMTAHYAWSQKASDIKELVVKGNSQTMNGLWISGYRTIRACNFAIDETDQYADENPLMANTIKGQAYALRAYLYFKLVNTFAQGYKFTPDASHPGVPYITTADITKPYSRQTVAEVYTGMIQDLTNAIQLLPGIVDDTRYMNRNAAKALLARIYLFKEDYANAKLLATEVANNVPLMNISSGYPNDIFKLKKPNETETLFQLVPSETGYAPIYLNFYFRYPGAVSFFATNDIASILIENTNDVRKAWVTRNNILPNTQGAMAVTKFPTNVAPEVKPAMTILEIAYYHCVIRSSEMYLTVAEASAKSGDDNTARTYLNAIRKRANPTIADVTASGPALLDSVYKERRKELCFESLRMFDLQRWKKGINRIDVLPGFPSVLPFPSDKAIAPIPLQDVQFAGISQNSSY